jgi:NAD(P)-dependent dehydrogenase (short-subunit alcohol dehydrogenase family)
LGIDILFNSAGIAIRRSVSDTEADDWDRIMETNLRGSFFCSKFCLEHFRQEGGSIIHVSSVTGIMGVRSRAAYSASKGALVALTRNMAIDLAGRNIRVNCVCPGFVRTPMAQRRCWMMSSGATGWSACTRWEGLASPRISPWPFCSWHPMNLAGSPE